MRIKSGIGDGFEAGVNLENRLMTSGIAASVEHHVNHHDKEAYNVLFAVNPDGAGDCFFYLLNDSNKNMDITLEGLWIQTSAAEEIYTMIAQAGPAVLTNGIALAQQNLNAGSGNVADVTCYGELADGGVDITGLIGGREVQRLWLTNAVTELFNFEQDIIIPPNQSFSMYCVGGDTLLRGTLVFNFHNEVLG